MRLLYAVDHSAAAFGVADTHSTASGPRIRTGVPELGNTDEEATSGVTRFQKVQDLICELPVSITDQ